MNKQKKGKKEEQMRKGEVGYTVGGIEGKGGKTEKRETMKVYRHWEGHMRRKERDKTKLKDE